MREYLVVVDMQNDFIDGALGTAEAVAVVRQVEERIRRALKVGRTLLFTQDTHTAEYMDTSEGRHLPVPHCIEGTPGWQLHPKLQPYATGTLRKGTFGSFSLIEALKKTAEEGGANLDVELCGVCTDICVVSNALLIRTHLPEATIRVYADACAGVTQARHEAALDVMRACQVEVV